MDLTVTVYRRSDDKYAWRAQTKNNEIVATDGGQGYENRDDAADMVRRLFGAHNIAIKFDSTLSARDD